MKWFKIVRGIGRFQAAQKPQTGFMTRLTMDDYSRDGLPRQPARQQPLLFLGSKAPPPFMPVQASGGIRTHEACATDF